MLLVSMPCRIHKPEECYGRFDECDSFNPEEPNRMSTDAKHGFQERDV